MAYMSLWKKLSATQLNAAIQAFSLIAIFFEGYDQGVMGGVNASPDYVKEVNIGNADGTITNETKMGGIVSVYYLGCMFGCFVGGWAADSVGRVNGIFYSAIMALVGGTLQAAAQSSDFMIVARVVTGLGTGGLVGITPVFVSEISKSDHRGSFLGYVFIANYLGISLAYWIDFGLAFLDNGYSPVRWRFLLAFQCFPAILLLVGVKTLPDSPRFLASVGRNKEAREVLVHLRGADDHRVEMEYNEITTMAEESKKSSPLEFVKVILGLDKQKAPHLGRRAWLAIFLQIMGSWTGITAVTAYSPVLLRQAGYSELTQNGLAGGLNTIGIVGTIISAQIVDRLGRRTCLMSGAAGLSAVNIIAASLYEVTRGDPSRAPSFAPAAVAMLFLFNLIYASTWGTVAFLLPTEIFPSEMRAQGNGFGITGWSIGVGMTTLINPILFASIENRAYFFFAALNFIWIPIIFIFYPETKDRSLESIESMFTTSPFFWQMEKAYKRGQESIVQEQGYGAPWSKSMDRTSHEEFAMEA
ncbi:hypothetical protein WHR41_02073 [Cladosporium halotolerans]|uniref:Major facilitator superfamily (MFS) profile domain-containing protein n=1 Tax=Cladosporium halotolerans TaxID=1052096 RepID=A0AB34KVP9_9PEZI